MSRRLLLVRHAHSPHPNGVEDHERPLSERGRQQAFQVAEELVDRDWLPDKAVSSDAERAHQTWNAMMPVLEAAAGTIEMELTNALYQADVDDITEVIWAQDEETRSLALVGHNPGFSDATGWLTGTSLSLSKGSAALIEIDGDTWADAVQESQGRLVELIRP
jgi:phosphohistidine phosphatase